MENKIGERRRLEYSDNGNNGQRRMIKDGQNNLNGEENLIVFDYISVTIGLQCSQEQ